MAKKKKSRSKKSRRGLSSEVRPIAIAIIEPMIDQALERFSPNLGLADDVVKAGLGFTAKKMAHGLVHDLGTQLYEIQLYKLGRTIAAGGFNLLGNSQSNDSGISRDPNF